MVGATDQGEIVDVAQAGALGVVYLKRFWARKMAVRKGGDPGAVTSFEMCADNVLLAGLKLGIRETLGFLMTTAPSFEAFEAWIVAKNGGSIESPRVRRLNGALLGDGSFALESILAEPVFSAEDLARWDEQGFVVLKQAVSAAQCRAAVQAIYEHTGMDANRPDSWYMSDLWIPLAQHPALWANRNAPRIHTAFSQLWQRDDLWMNVDVCGVNPPLRPDRNFRGTPLHWDMSLAPPIRFGTQAVLYLTDTALDQGAFSCVPGFHRRLDDWLRHQSAGADPRAQATRELEAMSIAGEAGDLIIWHQALPHGATPNRASSPRVVQYLNMFPSRYEVNAQWI